MFVQLIKACFNVVIICTYRRLEIFYDAAYHVHLGRKGLLLIGESDVVAMGTE